MEGNRKQSNSYKCPQYGQSISDNMNSVQNAGNSYINK